MIQHHLQIISNECIAFETYAMKLAGGSIVYDASPGQFLHIKSNRHDLKLRRPISIANIDVKNKTLTLIYRVVGLATKAFTILKNGEFLDVLGPLGSGYTKLENYKGKHVAIIGGGMGVAPLNALAKELCQHGAMITCILGYKSAKDIYLQDQFKALGTTIIATEDGSVGCHGNVEHALNTQKMSYDAVFACGPRPLLKMIQQRYKHLQNVYISLEAHMACGIGACYACCTNDKKYRVCHDGPVFNAKEVTI